MEERIDIEFFGIQEAQIECGGIASLEDLLTCEKSLLDSLNYNMIVSTPAEFLKVLLKIANPSTDFSEILARAQQYIFECMMCKFFPYNCLGAHFIGVRASSIGLASLLAVLETLDFQSFKEGILELLD